MAEEIDLQPVSHITTDAIGQPGKRVFYIQAWQGTRTITVIVEKIQVQSLAVGLEQFLAELQQRYPDLPEAPGDYDEEHMRIRPPVDPLFRVGELGLGYDTDNDRIVLVAREAVSEEVEENEEPEAEGESAEEGRVVRFWCTRAQLRAMCHWGMEVASRGRPICPQCGEPMDPEGHFCPKKNGHKH
ncbi:MAG: hypothetical protein A2W35_12295 [Chloroflexi bacterium RBG_16_57_11]|nr:MAG: hypothetical protein A2W35_12295 [Chloroflexi bacterium RBG_16_57_11]